MEQISDFDRVSVLLASYQYKKENIKRNLSGNMKINFDRELVKELREVVRRLKEKGL